MRTVLWARHACIRTVVRARRRTDAMLVHSVALLTHASRLLELLLALQKMDWSKLVCCYAIVAVGEEQKKSDDKK